MIDWIFTDVGMAASSLVASMLRLAPIEMQGWGHPVTSGSPNMDYYISSRNGD